jgi:hypothetical protein
VRKITISDGENTITLLPDLVFSIQPETIGTRETMASGKTVMDVVGEKITLEIPTGWLSAADLAALKAMIRRSHLLYISYPDVDGEKSDMFYVDHPVYKAFKYGADGVEQWYGVTLTATQYGVTTV